MSIYELLKQELKTDSRIWLITGAAGFIGSNLLEVLLKLNQSVVGLDNLSTGHQRNLAEIQTLVSSEQWARFKFIQGDIRSFDDCRRACEGVYYVLHQAALGSVPRSIEDPITTNQNNIDGFLNIMVAARDAKVERFIYAASSSTYGDHSELPKIEDKIGKPLSPYAITKLVNELYAEVFFRSYGFKAIGLRYFNVFGRRQDPNGPYAAVIPKWISAMINNEQIYINGDGQTSRDFCYIENVIQANLLAATTRNEGAINQVFNIAVGERTCLNDLYINLHHNLVRRFEHLKGVKPIYREFRTGDVLHSLADISKAKKMLSYQPAYDINLGLTQSLEWYINHLRAPYFLN